MPAFVPLLAHDASHDLKLALERIGPLVVAPRVAQQDPDLRAHLVLVANDAEADPENVTTLLDNGASKAILASSSVAKLAARGVPADRLVLFVDMLSGAALTDKLRDVVSGVFIKTSSIDPDTLASVKRFFPAAEIYVQPLQIGDVQQAITDLRRQGATLVIPSGSLTLGKSSETLTNVGEAFLAPLTSDRPDGLFPTVVTSYSNNRNLGLVYSSKESVTESIVTGKGVYQSRKHGLWRKGETSGATQKVVSIRADCDDDALEFVVGQADPGFCHLNRQSCFGDLAGIAQLERTLLSRLASAPPKSYTHRLFNDPDLLQGKIREEADELCAAKTKNEIAFEMADLLYFAMVKCVKNGVSLADVEACLDQKAKKVTRRPGNAKPQYSSPPATTNGNKSGQPNGYHPATPLANGHDRIRMRSVSIAGISPKERAALLQRPVLKSDDMIAKVKPIVDLVRKEGDGALRSLTSKYDKVDLSDVLIRPPFFHQSSSQCRDGTTSVEIDSGVRMAIDTAYGNITRFHVAQISAKPLVVETMPGVTCQRFAKAISRVGLYVPGGTAILPSTALMLGIPAQVAGCREVVIATPPRSDGTVSPEVLYVAHLVGATAILKAGGAQAVAALAYGTESVPKVDKIFGPGNQWVTAAKMLVQNDSDAMVSIDMPAGPSEVLVIADEDSNPAFVAADLLSQAEHGVDSQVVLVGINLSPTHLSAIETEVDKQAHELPRVDIVRESIGKSLVVNTTSLKEAMAFSNDYAPEHLIVNLKETSGVLSMVENAGSVFIGQFTPESCGDYASGTNHTLPTNGFARQYSGVNTQSFQKHITSQEITPDGLKKLGPTVVTLADCEGLTAHGNAVRVRLRELQA